MRWFPKSTTQIFPSRSTATSVVVARFDRFARSTRHLVLALEEFNALGVDFISLSESIDTSTPMGKIRLHV